MSPVKSSSVLAGWSPTLIRAGRNNTITFRVFGNNPSDGTGNWGCITIFAVDGPRPMDLAGKIDFYQGRFTRMA